jgi:tyrosyl-tRNA synthetase
MTSFITTLKSRGFFHQCTDEAGLSELMDKQPIPAYIGFDCTAPSLHVGSLMQIMILRMLQSHGFKPIVLMGGGTTKVGDPSGKDEARKLLDDEAIAANLEGIKQVLSKFIRFGNGATDAIMLNNDQWLSGISYIEFLRDYGKHFSVNRMMSFDSVKLRLEREQNLSFLEFNYMLLQAYDFVYLHRNHACRLQIGGSDQWGNIINGIELNRRLGEEEIFGLTTPLITTASGAKMGKSASGAVWLTEEMLSAYDYWQFWRNTEDADVERFLQFFTELPQEEISTILQGNINDAKKRLALEATTLCHGREKALQAAETARITFEVGGTAEGLPVIEVTASELQQGIPAYILFQRSNLAASGGEARRLIRGKGAKINDVVVGEEMQLINESYLNSENVIKLSAGKKNHVLIKSV